jgi:L-lactate dehydrogenase complex protein LldG
MSAASGSGSGAARAEVLARIRQANAAAARDPGRPAQAQPAEPAGAGAQAQPGYRTGGERGPSELLDLLTDRLTDYKATVRRTSAAGLVAEVTAALAERGVRRVVIPPGLDLAIAAGVRAAVGARPVPGASAGSGAGAEAAARAGAEVVVGGGQVVVGGGQIVVDGEPEALSPAALDGCDGAVTGAAVAIAETGTIVLDGSPDQGRRAITLVPDYHLCVVRADQVTELVPEAVARLAGTAGRPLTWISGPSATSDIELERVEGVHGPRTLEVILVES